MNKVRTSMTGKKYPPQNFEVEKGRIYDFVNAIEDPNPVYRYEEAAKAQGFEHIMVPPTYPIALRGEKGDTQMMLEDMGIDMSQILHGQQEFEYFKPLRPGETYVVQTTIKDIYFKEGRAGKMAFVVMENSYRDSANYLCVLARKTIIIRNAEPAE